MKRMHALILVCILCFVGRFYLNGAFPFTHDGENHLARFANYKIAVKEGQLPPRFAPNLYNHYGYPVFNYNYPLANIMSLPFSALGFSYELTFKILAVFFLCAGLVGFSKLMGVLDRMQSHATLQGAIAWLMSPYVVQLLYVRGSIGELAAFGLIPWLLWTVEGPLLQKRVSGTAQTIQTAVIWAAFFLSHNSSVLFVTPAIILLGAVRMCQTKTPWRRIYPSMLGWLLALFSSAWFWVPALLEQSATVVASASNQSEWASHFSTLQQLLFSPPQFGFSHPGSVDSLGLGVGIPLLAALTLAIAFGIYRVTGISAGRQTAQILKSPLLVYSALSLATLVLQLPMSHALWEHLPFVRFIQFPWRLTLLFTPLAAVVFALTYQRAPSPLRRSLFVILLCSGLFYAQLKPVDYFHRQTIDYDLFSQSTSTQNENRAAGFTYQNIADWQPTPTVMTGEASIRVLNWTGSKRDYELVVTQKATVVEPTMVFPGWRTLLTDSGGYRKAIEYTDSPEIAGRLAFMLEPGTYRVHTTFSQLTPARRIGNGVSAVAYVIMVILVVVTARNYRNLEK